MRSRRPRLPPAVGQAESEAADGRVGFEACPDLLEESIEGSIARRRIAFLDVDLDLDSMLVVGTPEAAERLLGLARIAVAQDLGDPVVGEDAGAVGRGRAGVAPQQLPGVDRRVLDLEGA